MIWYINIVHQESCPTLCDPMDCSSPGSTVHEIFQARILEWFATSFSRGSSQPRVWTRVSCTASRFFMDWATREAYFTLTIILKDRLKRRDCGTGAWCLREETKKVGMSLEIFQITPSFASWGNRFRVGEWLVQGHTAIGRLKTSTQICVTPNPNKGKRELGRRRVHVKDRNDDPHSSKLWSNVPSSSKRQLRKWKRWRWKSVETQKIHIFLKRLFLLIYLPPCGIFKVPCGMGTLGCSLWDLIPWPGIKPRPPALGGVES